MQIIIDRLTDADVAQFKDFCRDNWPGEHHLIHSDEMFEYYYRDADGGINFIAAKEQGSGKIQSVCGFIKSNSTVRPDVWTSFILTKKGAELNLGFKILEFIQNFTNCRTIACNNIRKKTSGLYQFLGWHIGDQKQYYRLNRDITDYTMCNIIDKKILSVSQADCEFIKIESIEELSDFEFETFSEDKPYKDRAYIKKRYFDNPWIKYQIYAIRRNRSKRALVVVRNIESGGACILRVVDFIGDRAETGQTGSLIDRLIKETGAEFCDWFAFGADDGVMARAGFCVLDEDDQNTIPFYLTPLKMENVTVTCFTSESDGYLISRADGDQDRPNLDFNY